MRRPILISLGRRRGARCAAALPDGGGGGSAIIVATPDGRGPLVVTARDLKVAIATAIVVVAGMSFTRAQTAVLSSRIFDWDSLKVDKTNVGFRRDVVKSPTATLDELEMHITTLNAGQQSHPPHQHVAEELLIIKEGTLEALVNGQHQKVGPGLNRVPGVEPAAHHQEHRHRSRDLSRHPVAATGDAEEIRQSLIPNR